MRTNFNSALTVIVVAVATLGMQQDAYAASSKEENIGVGSGAVIGGLAGGPVGIIIGAAIGAKMGDSYNQKKESIVELETTLDGTESQVVSLSGEVATLTDEVTRLKDVARPELVALMQAGIDMDLLFRTDESALTEATNKRLQRMASTLAGMPEVNIQLDGFADERGDEGYNQDLSEKRVDYVRNLFIAAGVSPTRIHSSAHGESIAADTSTDSFALERRVSVKLFIDNAESVASSIN
ncbi:MAG: OmpA family protein [Pseudomonadota bacterium]